MRADFLPKLNAREKIISYLTLSVISLAIVYAFIIEPAYRYWRNLNHEIILTKGKLQKSLKIIREKQGIDEEYALYGEKLKPKDTPEQEKTHILNTLDTIAGRSNLRILNIKPKPFQDRGFYNYFAVTIETESNMKALMRFIYEVKNSPLLLKVERLNLNTRSGGEANTIRASMSISRVTIKKPGQPLA